MRTPLIVVAALFWATCVVAQENAQMVIPKSLTECYTNWTYQVRENLPPFGITQLIEILRKVEVGSDSGRIILGIRSLAAALQHRFRQDGIERIPTVDAREGVIPFSPLGTEFVRHSILLRKFLPSSAPFPNETLTALERCTLHFMVSTNVAKWQRGDESSTCNNLHEYDSSGYSSYSSGIYGRRPGSNTGYGSGSRPGFGYIPDNRPGYGYSGSEYGSGYGSSGRGPYGGYRRTKRSVPEDVEIIKDINKLGQNADLNTDYPKSECPSEGGVVWTPWGGVSAGAMLAGIATGLERQNVPVAALVSGQRGYLGMGTGVATGRGKYRPPMGRTEPDYWRGSRGMEGRSIDNLWAATFAGDLAEVATMQGPTGQMTVGLQGGWNSTVLPRWYFLKNYELSAMTTNNIRGDLDGLILGSNIMSWYEKTGGQIRLSQVLDMYYSERGVFQKSIRACERKSLFGTVAPKETVTSQTQMFAPVLYNNNIYSVNLESDVIDEMSQIAVDRLFSYAPSQMNDPECDTRQGSSAPIVRPLVDIILILDTNWPYSEVVPLVSYILDKTEASIYGSNLTIINAKDGSIRFASRFPLLEFHIKYTQEVHESGPRGFDTDAVFTSLADIEYRKWLVQNRERLATSQGQVMLFAPTAGVPNAGDGTSARDRFQYFRLRRPDWHMIFITKGNKNVHQDLVDDRDRDVFQVSPTEIPNTVGPLIERLKQVPSRLFFAACDPSWRTEGDVPGQSYDYIEPESIRIYRLHPSYFFRSTDAKIRVTVSNAGTLNVCHSRQELRANDTTNNRPYGPTNSPNAKLSSTCQQVTPNSYMEVTLSDPCSDTNYVSKCDPFYLSVASTQTSETANNYQCTDAQCRFPDMTKYSISLRGMGCWNAGSTLQSTKHFLMVLPLSIFVLMRYLYLV